MIICKKCNTPNTEGTTFCQKCGALLSDSFRKEHSVSLGKEAAPSPISSQVEMNQPLTNAQPASQYQPQQAVSSFQAAPAGSQYQQQQNSAPQGNVPYGSAQNTAAQGNVPYGSAQNTAAQGNVPYGSAQNTAVQGNVPYGSAQNAAGYAAGAGFAANTNAYGAPPVMNGYNPAADPDYVSLGQWVLFLFASYFPIIRVILYIYLMNTSPQPTLRGFGKAMLILLGIVWALVILLILFVAVIFSD